MVAAIGWVGLLLPPLLYKAVKTTSLHVHKGIQIQVISLQKTGEANGAPPLGREGTLE